jgi:hypothetical protein
MTPLISGDAIAKLNALGGFLRSNLIGQDEVIESITGLLQRSCCDMRYDMVNQWLPLCSWGQQVPERPIWSNW